MIGFVDLQLGKTFLFCSVLFSIYRKRTRSWQTNQGRRKTLVQPEGNRAKLYRVTYLVSPPPLICSIAAEAWTAAGAAMDELASGIIRYKYDLLKNERRKQPTVSPSWWSAAAAGPAAAAKISEAKPKTSARSHIQPHRIADQYIHIHTCETW